MTPSIADPLSKSLLVITGKGGVGKSTVAAALGRTIPPANPGGTA